ncbi:hypothetical protein [Brevundimonas sp.]|uniref:hypothetical protein n=1 Tax=Brevundimonas sp. TaxID=1871086 RepID=UPI002FDB40E8
MLIGAAIAMLACTYLPGLVADFNGRFAKVPANDKDLHRPLLPTDRIEDEFAWQVERSVSQNLTLQYDTVLLLGTGMDTLRAAVEAVAAKQNAA